MQPEPSASKRVIAVLCAALLAAGPRALAAQDAAPAAAPGSELTVHLVTVDYGDAIWQNFGHNAIRIQDAVRGTDIAYNYGVFDFDEPGFMLRFLRGEMEYILARFDFGGMVRAYRSENRTILQQRLDLTPAERVELQQFLERNALPENRAYRYDYFRDNCSTRVRDALDRVLGGALRTALEPVATGRTYRYESLRLTSANVPIYAGIDLGLGPFTDRPLNAWQESFIPMRLAAYARDLTVPGPDGAMRRLVAEETVLFQATREPPPETPPRRFPDFLFVGIATAALILGAGRLSDRSRAATLALALLLFLWALATGLLGVVLTALWTLTGHVSAYRNENLFQTNPLALGLAVAAPAAQLFGRFVTAARRLALVLAGLSVLGLLFGLLPASPQSTGRIIALLLPVHLAVAWVHVRTLRAAPGPSSRRDGGERAWRAREARAQGRHR